MYTYMYVNCIISYIVLEVLNALLSSTGVLFSG